MKLDISLIRKILKYVILIGLFFFIGQTIDSADVEVTLAKPVDKEHYRQQRAVAKLMQMANQYQHFPSVLPDMNSFNGMPPFNNQMPGLVYPPPPFMPPYVFRILRILTIFYL